MSVKLLLYCTKAKPYLIYDYYDNSCGKCITADKIERWHLNGKIVCECDCEYIDYYQMEYYANNLVMNDISIYNKIESEEWGHDCFNRVISNEYSDEEIANCPLLKKSCLSFDELGEYVCPKGGIDNFYALHLSNVKVFDEPKELAKCTLDNNSDYYVKKWIKKFDSFKGSALTKAPQNMCNVYDKNCNHYILISIRPEHLCKILNGEKTIEVRKKILNSLKEVLHND